MSQEKLKSAKNLFFIALGIDIAVTALVIMADIWTIGVLNDIRSGASTASQSTISTLGFWEGFSQLTILTMIGVGFGLVKWLKSSYHFAKDSLGATGFKNEGWTWAGWIIPILNVFKPYQIINEIYKAGAPTYTTSDGWKKESDSWLLLTWWIFWVVTHLIVAIIGKEFLRSPMHDDVTLQQAFSMTSLQVWACAISIIIAGLWFVVAGNLTRRLLSRSAPVLASVTQNHSPATFVTTVPAATNFSNIVHPENHSSIPPQTSVNVQIQPNNNHTTVTHMNTFSNTQQTQPELDTEERFYEIVAEELESGNMKKGLWTKAFAESGGDDKTTKSLYIKWRVGQLADYAAQQKKMAAEQERNAMEQLERERSEQAERLAACRA